MPGRIFIAGVIQGPFKGKEIWSQDYRKRLKEILSRFFPGWDIYCPFENHPESVNYSDDDARKTFLHHIEVVRSSNLLVAYLPTASMGTAIEMWEAYKNGIPVWTITTLSENWVVRITSSKVFGSIDELEKFLQSRTPLTGNWKEGNRKA